MLIDTQTIDYTELRLTEKRSIIYWILWCTVMWHGGRQLPQPTDSTWMNKVHSPYTKIPFFLFKTESSQWNFKRSYIFQFFLYNTAVTIPGCSKSPHYYDIIIDLMHMSSYNRLASWWVFCNKTKLYYIILTCNIFFSVLNSVIGVIDSPVVLDYWDS